MNDLMEKRLASIVERPWARQLWAMKPNLSSARQIASSPSFQFQLGMFSRWAWGNKTRYETLLCPMFNCLESLLGNTVLPNIWGHSDSSPFCFAFCLGLARGGLFFLQPCQTSVSLERCSCPHQESKSSPLAGYGARESP